MKLGTEGRSRSTASIAGSRLLAVAIAALVLTACGSNDPSPTADSGPPDTTPTVTSAPTETAATPAAAPAGTGACQYVSTEEAGELATSPVKAGVNRSVPSGPITYDSCHYIFDPGNSPGVLVSVAGLGADSASLFSQYRESKSSENAFRTVAGVGDEAFFAGQNLYVRTGETGLILYVGRANGYPRGPEGLPDAKKLAALVLGRL